MTNVDNNNFSCSHSDDLVSYLYDEMPTREKGEFETHLLDCSDCTEEFAGLSLARLSVYEYHRDDFACLVTPRIDIPYVKAFEQLLETAPVRPSWSETFRGLFTATPKWAATVAAALITVSIAVGFIVMNLERDDNEIAVAVPNNDPSTNISPPVEVKPEVDVFVAKSLETNNDMKSGTLPLKPAASSSSGSRKAPNLATVRKSATVTSAMVSKPQRPSRRSAPRLNNFEDEDDNTLRLADLFAEVESRR